MFVWLLSFSLFRMLVIISGPPHCSSGAGVFEAMWRFVVINRAGLLKIPLQRRSEMEGDSILLANIWKSRHHRGSYLTLHRVLHIYHSIVHNYLKYCLFFMHCNATQQLNVLFLFRVTNGGKTTLTNSLIETLPNCCVVHQDDFFKVSLGDGKWKIQGFVSLFTAWAVCVKSGLFPPSATLP